MKLHGEEVKIGDKVWHWSKGWGEVVNLDEGNTNYPICVRWEWDWGWFSKDGRSLTVYKVPVLFWQPIVFEIPKKPLYPYTCIFCGAPSQLEPIDQSPPPDYCHPSDHEAEEDYE